MWASMSVSNALFSVTILHPLLQTAGSVLEELIEESDEVPQVPLMDVSTEC